MIHSSPRSVLHAGMLKLQLPVLLDGVLGKEVLPSASWKVCEPERAVGLGLMKAQVVGNGETLVIRKEHLVHYSYGWGPHTGEDNLASLQVTRAVFKPLVFTFVSY